MVASGNPYDAEEERDLHAAWEEGRKAYLEGEPLSTRHVKNPERESIAWVKGYLAAQLSELGEG